MVGEYIKSENFRISFALGTCLLDPHPLGIGQQALVYKGRLNGFPLVVKFFPGSNSGPETEEKTSLQTEYLRISLLEKSDHFIQYVGYDILPVGDARIPVLLMPYYPTSLAAYRAPRSVQEFRKLYHFLVGAVTYLHQHGLTGRAITPPNILIDTSGAFRLSDHVIAYPDKGASDDIRAIGEILQYYLAGPIATPQPPSHYFKELTAYDTILERCLARPGSQRFGSIDEINVALARQQAPSPGELREVFNLICRKNFPKELPDFVHCTDQKKISKLMADFVERKDYFGNNLLYFTDAERKIFSPGISENGFYKFDNSSEFKIIDLWIHCNNELNDDYILVHHAYPAPVKVNGKDTYKWAVYNHTTPITWTEAMNGFAELEGDIVPLDPTKIEFFCRKDQEGYLFIGLGNSHRLAHPANLPTLRDYFFRFRFNYVNRLILEDMNRASRRHLPRVD